MPGLHGGQETVRPGLPQSHFTCSALASRNDDPFRPDLALAAEQSDSLQAAQQDVFVTPIAPMDHIEIVGNMHGIVDQVRAPQPVGIDGQVVG